MKITLRIECPHCRWGHQWKNEYVNMGWRYFTCGHCGNRFKTRITIDNISIESKKLEFDESKDK